MDSHSQIVIKGARENNLKNIDITIPKNKLIVLTGLSGSGKSSIAFDTLQKECQRQYLESMGFVTDNLRKPKVDSIVGLSPSISVDQRNSNYSPRSTVGTSTEIFTYLRVLFAKLGQRPCPKCGHIVEPSFEGEQDEKLDLWSDAGESVTEGETEIDEMEKEAFSGIVLCPECQAKMPELTMAHFSFNKPEGACPECTGLGVVNTVNIAALVDPERSILDGAVSLWNSGEAQWNSRTLINSSKYFGFSFDPATPVSKLDKAVKALLLYGVNDYRFRKYYPDINPPTKHSEGRFEGITNIVLRRYAEHINDTSYLDKMGKYMIMKECPACSGTRLRAESRSVTVGGKSIIDVSEISLYKLSEWIESLQHFVSEKGLLVTEPIVSDLRERIKRLIDVGVGYLNMARSAPSLSAGECQRLRLASLLGSGLTGVLYVLDEPTIGLHQRDTARLITVLKQLRDLGNTVMVIEHDIEMIKAADYIIDIGPGAGKNGGRVVAAGTPQEVAENQESMTGRCLSGLENISIPLKRRAGNGKSLTIIGASEHNLKNIDVRIPLGVFVAVTGVSGSGKSTLMFDILDRAARQVYYGASELPGKHDRIIGWDNIDKVITIDQLPIGRIPRSNAATYTDVFTPIRNLFSDLPESRLHNLEAKHFSFNVPGGRCEKCEGAGVLNVSMHFLPSVQVQCPVCRGKRFKQGILNILYKGCNISDVLNMTVQEAAQLFSDIKPISSRLLLMAEVGLGYLQLGQPATTLSGGEAQRIKLAKELGKKGKGHTLYLLDEPTTGLHPYDTMKLVSILQRLVDNGNTVIVIEHNMEVIRMADCVIDIGPEGGDSGGRLIVEGTPEQVAMIDESITGNCLRQNLNM